MIYEGEYNKLKADLTRKGLGGIVEQIEKDNHYYKNVVTTPTEIVSDTPLKTKNEPPRAISKNERAAVGQTAAILHIGVVN